jgi:hypothetical protein
MHVHLEKDRQNVTQTRTVTYVTVQSLARRVQVVGRKFGGVEVQLHAFLTSASDEGKWSALHPGCFTPRETAHGTHWIGHGSGQKIIFSPPKPNYTKQLYHSIILQ